MPNRLAGKVALITGAASGMGRAQAKIFAAEGAAICVADINDAGGQKVVAEIIADGGQAIFAHVDVREADQWQAAVTATESQFGSLTVLCNNAGANFRVSFDEQTEEMWHLIIETALTGAFLGIKAAVPRYAPSGEWLHHQYWLHCYDPSRAKSRLLHQQSRYLGLDPSNRQSLRARKHPLQFGLTRTYRYPLYP